MDSLMTYVPLMLVMIALATLGYMVYVVQSLRRRAERQDRDWLDPNK